MALGEFALCETETHEGALLGGGYREKTMVDTSSVVGACSYRGGFVVHVLRSYRIILIVIAVVAAVVVAGLAKLAVTAGLLAGWVIVVYFENPKRLSVEIEGDLVTVRNPMSTHQFRAEDLTVVDTPTFTRIAQGATDLIDKDGRRVTCYGLGRKIPFYAATELEEFKTAIRELGGSAEKTRRLWW